MHYYSFYHFDLYKKSPATYASMLIKTNWNQNLLCYYFFLKQKFWNLNDFDTTLSFGQNKVICLYMQW